MSEGEHKRLQRLNDSFYQGRSYVHWIQTIKNREVGWLTELHRGLLRDVLFHACARYHLVCPVYCLMPDQGHFLFVGLNERADQLAALKWIRREWNAILRPHILQSQAYDYVLRETDRARDAFGDVVGYILRNPVRKELVTDWQEWSYSGAVFPGYPNLEPRKIHFWQNFWDAYLIQSES